MARRNSSTSTNASNRTVRSVRRMRPDLPDDRAAALERSLRLVCTAHVLDPTARDGELRVTVVGALYS